MEKFTFDLAIGKKLHTEQEPDNAVDKFAMKVVKNNETVGRLSCEYSQIFWYSFRTWLKDMRGSDWLQMSLQTAVGWNGDKRHP